MRWQMVTCNFALFGSGCEIKDQLFLSQSNFVFGCPAPAPKYSATEIFRNNIIRINNKVRHTVPNLS